MPALHYARRGPLLRQLLAGIACSLWATLAVAADKPNILVIWGDDIGITNISAYSDGMMGYRTPNIDKIASGGLTFTQFYANCPVCSPSRASLLSGMFPREKPRRNF